MLSLSYFRAKIAFSIEASASSLRCAEKYVKRCFFELLFKSKLNNNNIMLGFKGNPLMSKFSMINLNVRYGINIIYDDFIN